MQSFGAYGQRRGTNWSGTPTPADLSMINATTRKGFTEHEMLDSTGLVHMTKAPGALSNDCKSARRARAGTPA